MASIDPDAQDFRGPLVGGRTNSWTTLEDSSRIHTRTGFEPFGSKEPQNKSAPSLSSATTYCEGAVPDEAQAKHVVDYGVRSIRQDDA